MKNLIKELKHPVHIVLTNSDSLDENGFNEYVNELKSIDTDLKIFKICSIEETKRSGKKTEQFGKKELLENMFGLIRDDILEKFSFELEKDYKHEIIKTMSIIENKIYKLIDEKVGFFGVFKLFNNFDGVLQEISERLQDEFDKMEEEQDNRMDRIVKQNLIPLRRFFYKYKNVFLDENEISQYDIDFNFYSFDIIDIEETLQKTEMGVLIKKIEDEEANLSDFLNIGWKVVTIGDTLKSLVAATFSELRSEINKEDIKEDIRLSLENLF